MGVGPLIDLTPWIGIAGVALTVIMAWVRLNSQLTKLETKTGADKDGCDASLALIRVEAVAIEMRANERTNDLRALITRMDGKVDRLLERHS